MVAITVTLAAVIGTFVIGLGDQVQQTTPRVSFGLDTAENKHVVEITHESGDTVEAGDLTIKSTTNFNTTSDGDALANTDSATWAEATGDDEVSAGSTASIGGDDSNPKSLAGATIRVVYDSPDSDNTATLGKFEVPN